MLTAWKNIAGITTGLELATIRTGMFLEPHSSLATFEVVLVAEQHDEAAAAGFTAAVIVEAQGAVLLTLKAATVFASALPQETAVR